MCYKRTSLALLNYRKYLVSFIGLGPESSKSILGKNHFITVNTFIKARKNLSGPD